MAIIVSLINGGSYEFGPESDEERLRWEIGEHGQLAIIKQVLNEFDYWHDDGAIRVFSSRHWADVEIVE